MFLGGHLFKKLADKIDYEGTDDDQLKKEVDDVLQLADDVLTGYKKNG